MSFKRIDVDEVNSTFPILEKWESLLTDFSNYSNYMKMGVKHKTLLLRINAEIYNLFKRFSIYAEVKKLSEYKNIKAIIDKTTKEKTFIEFSQMNDSIDFICLALSKTGLLEVFKTYKNENESLA